MTIDVKYPIAPQGLGTDFSKFERPLTFAETYTNRFRNITGGAERRPGMTRYGSKVATFPNLTRLHELVTNNGEEILFSSDDFGKIYRYDTTTSAWSNVYTFQNHARVLSIVADGKIIFYNGIDRNIYTSDGTSFNELKAIITKGKTAGGTNTTTIIDGDVSNWIGGTLVSNNDIIHNVTKGGYGIVTTVASAALTTTIIGGTGAGASGEGQTTSGLDQSSGDAYELIDYVDLNIIPIGAVDGSDGLGNDNVATATGITDPLTIAVSGVNFANTEIRKGDIIYNTTRGFISFVNSVSANVALTKSISGQTAGDAITFFKSSMPITSWAHVHYGRAAFLDARNKNDIIFSAPDDPEDVTTFQKTLESTSFSFATQQPAGDSLLCLGTFLSYFVAAGKKNIYIFRGNNPIQDASGSDISFEATAVYPNGLSSRFSFSSNGGDLLTITREGLQAVSIGYNNSSTVQNNASVAIRNNIKNAISAVEDTDNIQNTHYPRRSWTICKVGDVCYVLNTNPSYNEAGQLSNTASWHLFTGKWAQQNHYFVRRNGDLLACGANGLVYTMDDGAAIDDGEAIATNITTAWLRLEEPQNTPRIKEGKYIKPIFESGPNIGYNINAVAGWDNYSSDSIVVSAGGTGAIGSYEIGTDAIGGGEFAQANKYPLRWRGEQVRLQITTNSSAAPDILTGLILYGTIGGRR